MKISDLFIMFLIVIGIIWVVYRVVISFENGLINGMIHLIVLGASTWAITYYANLRK